MFLLLPKGDFYARQRLCSNLCTSASVLEFMTNSNITHGEFSPDSTSTEARRARLQPEHWMEQLATSAQDSGCDLRCSNYRREEKGLDDDREILHGHMSHGRSEFPEDLTNREPSSEAPA